MRFRDLYARYRARWIPAFAGMTVVLLLAACISGVKEPDTYTDRAGKTTLIETDRETCTRSCNQDYSRCMDIGPAEVTGANGPSGMFGASADCRKALKDCLPTCEGR